jgi:TolA-binding protein
MNRKMEEQMTFSYDETDNHDETDDFDDEPQDSYPDEEDDDLVDVEDDADDSADDSATALSHAFREVVVPEVVEDHEDEMEDSAEEADDDDTDDDDTEAYEQRLAEAIDALPDEEDLEVVVPPLELPSLEVELLRPQERDNLAYADAIQAYYEEKDYQRAIEKFGEAIEDETQRTDGSVTDSSSIVVKAMYWQAEAYVKMQDIPQAIVTFESLIQTYQEHHLSLAAQRRTEHLNPK